MTWEALCQLVTAAPFCRQASVLVELLLSCREGRSDTSNNSVMDHGRCAQRQGGVGLNSSGYCVTTRPPTGLSNCKVLASSIKQACTAGLSSVVRASTTSA